jgi:hypothetical protein
VTAACVDARAQSYPPTGGRSDSLPPPTIIDLDGIWNAQTAEFLELLEHARSDELDEFLRNFDFIGLKRFSELGV